MNKKILLIFILLITAAFLYFLNQKTSIFENDENFAPLSIKCPDNDYDWESLTLLPSSEINIDCPLYDNQKISLVAKKSDDKASAIYKVYIAQNTDKLFLGDISLQTPGGVRQFNVTTMPSKKLIKIYSLEGDMGGFTENGWFVNLESKKFVKYSVNNSGISSITTDNAAYNIKYSLKKGTINDYKSYVGKDMIITGLLLNNEPVVTFNDPVIIKYNASQEIRPYDILPLAIESFSPSFNTVTIVVDEKEKFNINLNK